MKRSRGRGAAILLLTARTWLMLLGGYPLFGALKSLVLVGTGSFPSHGFSTRVEPLALVFYCVATLMLLFRFAENPPTVLDRVALTVYLFCLWPAATTSAFSWWQGVGLGALLASWCVFRRADVERIVTTVTAPHMGNPGKCGDIHVAVGN